MASVMAVSSLAVVKQAKEGADEGDDGEEKGDGHEVQWMPQGVDDWEGGVSPVAGKSGRQKQEEEVEGREEAIGQNLRETRFDSRWIIEPVEGDRQGGSA